jgi:hypothetical protein
MLFSDFDQSKFMKASDLGEIGSEKKAKIKAFTKEVIGEEQQARMCVWFTNLQKALLLNKTNLRALQAKFGDSAEASVGKVVILYSIMAPFRGQIVPALRLRIPPPKDGAKAAPAPPPPVEEEL